MKTILLSAAFISALLCSCGGKETRSDYRCKVIYSNCGVDSGSIIVVNMEKGFLPGDTVETDIRSESKTMAVILDTVVIK